MTCGVLSFLRLGYFRIGGLLVPMTFGMRVRLVLFAAVSLALAGCRHEPDQDPMDARLLELARDADGHVWYKGSDSFLPKSAGSGHTQALLRTRYNNVAGELLDANGQVLPDTVFADGSLIVKELWDDASTLSLYAILLKEPADPNADGNGWVWGYIQPDGTVLQPSSAQGAACRSCHSQEGNIDFSLMNKYFP